MPSAKKILITINTSWNIYNFRMPLVEALREQGCTVITAAPEDAYTPRLMAMVDQHFRLPMSNSGTSPLQDIGLFLRYRRLLKREKPDIVLAYTIKPNVYGTLAASLLGIPVINNVSGLGTAFIRRNWLTQVVKGLYRLAFRYSAQVFFQNPHDRALFVAEGLVDSDKTVTLPGSGVDLTYYQPQPVRQKEQDTACDFILIARMLWDKGIGEYVDAARMVKAQYPEAQFRLLGPVGIDNKTSISEHTIQGWQEEGVVQYLGETDEVRDIIAQHDCVVLPSYREGMSRVLLEAAAMGKPMIASDVPGCADVVTHGTNGLLCKVQDAASLAEQMLAFIQLSPQERQKMGQASREKAEQEFDQALVITTYLETIASFT